MEKELEGLSPEEEEVDVESVMNGTPWIFNNHLLLLHRLQEGDDPNLAQPRRASIIPSVWLRKDKLGRNFEEIGGKITATNNSIRECNLNLKNKQDKVKGIVLSIEEKEEDIEEDSEEISLERDEWKKRHRSNNHILGRFLSKGDDGLGDQKGTNCTNQISFNSPKIVFLMETKVDKYPMERIRLRCGFQFGIDVPAIGTYCGVSLGWKEEISVSLRSFSNNHIDVDIDDFERTPWLVYGDFNEILYSFKKEGGLPRDERRMEEFQTTINICRLEDVGFTDYCPLLFQTKREGLRRRIEGFRFKAWWVMKQPCEEEVKRLWEMSKGGMEKKLEYVWKGLQMWAWGIKKSHKELSTKLLARIEELDGIERTKKNLEYLIDVKIHLNLEIDKDERIEELENERGQLVIEKKKMADVERRYFQELFLSGGISNLIFYLGLKLASQKKVEPTKASERDGFPALFFQKYWHIGGKEVSNFCLNILNKDRSIEEINTTNIVPIPKVANPVNHKSF
ncbi:hypothetical protein Gorai_007575 [Gossypium raimondii]|uniref:Endonuclease/exonuclease/phosphatase domain-containing protein n=1 Tax=Gossypium raimondii TaxID=29730 RepID=A0A7J8Q8B4_GOSRA|nr:hypothetical protein [Gossypium raimondii]